MNYFIKAKTSISGTEQNIIDDGITSTGRTWSSDRIESKSKEYVDHTPYCVAKVISGSATVTVDHAVRFGNYLSVSLGVNPTASFSAGDTVIMTLTDSKATLPSVSGFGVDGGATFYSSLCFSYEFNRDSPGQIKLRVHNSWTANYGIGVKLNIPLLDYTL